MTAALIAAAMALLGSEPVKQAHALAVEQKRREANQMILGSLNLVGAAFLEVWAHESLHEHYADRFNWEVTESRAIPMMGLTEWEVPEDRKIRDSQLARFHLYPALAMRLGSEVTGMAVKSGWTPPPAERFMAALTIAGRADFHWQLAKSGFGIDKEHGDFHNGLEALDINPHLALGILAADLGIDLLWRHDYRNMLDVVFKGKSYWRERRGEGMKLERIGLAPTPDGKGAMAVLEWGF